ncbi:MAG: hypothetical protein ACOCRO_05385 [Halanaerobiales bacterium]
MIDKPSHFFIRKYRDGWILINKKGERKNHTHLKKKDTCHLLVRLICSGTVPDKGWLRKSALRVSLDPKYKQKIRIKIEKDKQKPKYVNQPTFLR